MSQKIIEILEAETRCGFEMYACLKSDEGLVCTKFNLEDKKGKSFKDFIREKIANCIYEKYLPDTVELKQVDDIHDNTNTLFEIIQSDIYKPFEFIDHIRDNSFSDDDKPQLQGFLFRFNVNNRNKLWTYQQIYPVTIPQKKNGVYVFFKDDVYKEFTNELLRIDYRVDLIILDESIITSNIKLLQSKFGFEIFIRKESQKAIRLIEEMDVIEDLSKIIEFEGADSLTNAKKLMKIKNSPVLKMRKKDLLNKLRTMPRFANKVKIENGKIQIKSKKAVLELLKVLNDDYLKSELTNADYESSNKKLEKK